MVCNLDLIVIAQYSPSNLTPISKNMCTVASSYMKVKLMIELCQSRVKPIGRVYTKHIIKTF